MVEVENTRDVAFDLRHTSGIEQARADELLLYIVRQDHVPFAPVDVAVSLSFVTELLDSADEFSLDRVGLTARGHVGMPQCACFLLVLHSAQHRCYRPARPGHLGALTAAMGVRSRQPVDRSSSGRRGRQVWRSFGALPLPKIPAVT